MGMGSATFRGPIGPVTLRDVLHIPELKKNFISVPRLAEKNLIVQMLRDKCVIKGTYGTGVTMNKSCPFFMMELMAV